MVEKKFYENDQFSQKHIKVSTLKQMRQIDDQIVWNLTDTLHLRVGGIAMQDK